MSFVAAYNSGLGHYENGDYDDAIHDYNLALEFDPKNTFTCLVYSNRGVAYRKKGEYDQALADYTQAITLDPNGSQHYCNRGLLHELLGRKGEAIADFEMVIQLQRDAALVQKATQALERLQSREQP
jgi:tetratricopeptide (TPR) repeat protein